MRLPIKARAFVTLVIVLGLGVLGTAVSNGINGIHAARLAVFVVIACVAARLKVKLPGMTGSMSVNLPFILIATAEMSLPEALIIGCISNFVQCLPADRKKFSFVQTLFNLCNMALAIGATRAIYELPTAANFIASHSLRLATGAAAFFLINTVPVAIVLTLTESRRLVPTWLEMAQLSYPYFVASAGVAGVTLTISDRLGWQTPIAILAIMLGVFYSYRRYFSSMSQATGEMLRKASQSTRPLAAETAKAGAR